MNEKLTIFDIWSIDSIKAISYYRQKGIFTDDHYLTMILEAKDNLTDEDRRIIEDTDFIRNLKKYRNISHQERLVLSLYESEGGILSKNNLAEMEEEQSQKEYIFESSTYAVYESKFRYFDFLNSTEEEITEHIEKNFFKHSKLMLKGNREFIRNFVKMDGIKTLVLENNELTEISHLDLEIDKLESLFLNNNRLTRINYDTLSDGLRLLDISYNNFSSFTYNCLPLSLRSLNLSFNPLKIIDLEAMKYLEILDLSNTNISILENLPRVLRCLTVLNCEKLEAINLDNNYVMNFNTNNSFTIFMVNSYIDVLSCLKNQIKFHLEYSNVNSINKS